MSLHDSIMASIVTPAPVSLEVPEWNCTVYLREFSVAEWLDLVATDEGDRPWRILAAAMRDENGDPVLSSAEIVAMPSKQTPVLLRLFQEVQRINGGDDAPGES